MLMIDIRERWFQTIRKKTFRAAISTEEPGILSGTAEAAARMEEIGATLEWKRFEGDAVRAGDVLGILSGSPVAVARAEESVLGTLMKASGIATAAAKAVAAAEGRVQIVSGGWKKMPPDCKKMVRQAVCTGGALFRICEPPMLYMDKNILRMFGSVSEALQSCRCFPEAARIVQIHGVTGPVEEEIRQAAEGGVSVCMVDTGRIEDMRLCDAILRQQGLRGQVRVAFAGNLKIADIAALRDEPVDLLDIGKEIIDAPLLNMKLDVLTESEALR